MVLFDARPYPGLDDRIQNPRSSVWGLLRLDLGRNPSSVPAALRDAGLQCGRGFVSLPRTSRDVTASMLFNSAAYAVFFAVVTGLYFSLPHRSRWALLLFASCGFYMWFRPVYILILGFTIVIDYFAGLWIEGSQGLRRRWALGLSLAANIGILAVFKYWNFGQANLDAGARLLGWTYTPVLLRMALPIGLSFHTFQAMSYTIEVYRGRQRAERHFGIYSLYVMFFPQLVAGPIERPQNLLGQFRVEHAFDYDRVTSGLRLMAWGLFKKICVADRLSILVNRVYEQPEHFEGPWLAVATGFFAIQIYCDFSGYSDMALGAARILGFRLMRNFDHPYSSRSVGEFWRRWHISLSTWFKDYVYVPLGGSRVGLPRQFVNLMIVFLLSGLWHGANWTYLVWGAIHGTALIGSVATASLRDRIRRAVAPFTGMALIHVWQRLCVIGIVCVGWVFFRATSVHQATVILRGMASGWSHLRHPASLYQSLWDAGYGRIDLMLAIGLIAGVFGMEHFERHRPVNAWICSLPAWNRRLIYYGFVAAIFWLAPGSGDQFIYFQF